MGNMGGQNKSPILFAIICGYVIFSCLWKLFVPATEYELPPWPLVSVALDLLLAIVLFILKLGVPAPDPVSPVHIRYATPLFVSAIAASAIMILIRVSSERGWWTGHLMYSY